MLGIDVSPYSLLGFPCKRLVNISGGFQLGESCSPGAIGGKGSQEVVTYGNGVQESCAALLQNTSYPVLIWVLSLQLAGPQKPHAQSFLSQLIRLLYISEQAVEARPSVCKF